MKFEEIVNSRIENARNHFIKKDISFLSQNCIGGLFYSDMGMRFLTPTINLYFESKDFIRFVSNFDYYLNCELVMLENTPYTTGMLDDVKIIFLHYPDANEAKEKWNERKKRILKDRIFVICTDRDGFDDEDFENFKKINYPKALLTRNQNWKDYDFVVYFEHYKDLDKIPDTSLSREFYLDNKLIDLINKMN